MNNLSSVYTSEPLTGVSLKYKNETDGFIADKISPIVPVVKDSAKIYTYGAESLRLVNTIRSVGGKPNTVDISYTSADHYSLEDHVLGDFLPEEIEENADRPLNPRIDTTEALTDILMIAKEKALADSLQSASIITQNITLAGGDQWSDYTNSDPLDDIKTGIKAVRAGSLKVPNTLIIAWDTMLTLQFHPAIKDMFPGAQAITSEMIRAGIGRMFPYIKNVVVGMVAYNNTNKATALSVGEIWTKTAIVAYIEPNPTLRSRSLSFTYQKKAPRMVEVLEKGQGGLETVQRKSTYIQVSDKYDQVIVDNKCAYLIAGAIA